MMQSNLSSAPLKKRNKLRPCIDTGLLQGSDEEVAAAALSQMNRLPVQSSSSEEDATSDSELSSASGSSNVPKTVHRPPVNSTMVDHTYTDYSVVRDELLSCLMNDEDNDSDSEISEMDKKAKEKAIKKIKKIFGDISPTRKNSGGVVKPFPEKLMEVLDRGDMDNIITYLPHGRAFIVRHSQQLKEVVLPRFFKQSKFMSFTRQLNLWGFKRITKGPDAGAYYHELFLRGRPLLSMLMRRQKIKGTGIKLTPNPDTEPNFYKISTRRPLPPALVNREVQPLPPISNTVSASRATRQASKSSKMAFNNPSLGRNADLYMPPSPQHSNMGHAQMMQSMAQQQRMSFNDQFNMDMFQREARRPFQRFSTPVTQTDFNAARNSFQETVEEQAVASAQQLLHEVNGHSQVEQLKKKLLDAVQSLEQAQTQQPVNHQQRFPSNLLGSVREHGMPQHAYQSLNPYRSMLSQNPFPSQQHQNLLLQQQQQHQHQQQQQQQQQQQNYFGQTQQHLPQGGTNISALMSALDQTRQVAAAAQAQSSLLQKVANDLALGRHND